jgi:hypothetical protein
MKDIKMGLKILKENEEGFGIIVDQDGNITKELNESFLNEGTLSGSIDLTKPIYYYATLQKYGVENRNGRIYPEDILKREVERYRDVIRRNASFHELDHPQESVISLKGGSPHRIVDMFWEGNALIGKLEILVSEGYRKNGVISCNGDLTAMYLSYGMTLGISSRGIGSLKKVNGKNVVQNDFELICWDIVSSPSTPGSYLYKNPEDFAKYDEKLTNEPGMNIGSKDKQDEFLSKLTSFLSK